MKITVDGTTRSIPTKWDDVTFEQFLKIKGCKDRADILSIFLGIDAGKLRIAQIENLREVLSALKFMDKLMAFIVPRSINGYNIPKDLNLKTVGQYEDLKDIAKELGENGENISVYPEMVGVYAMPNYNTASLEERKQFSQQFFKSSCAEVMAIGNFTVVKLIELSLPGSPTSRKANILMHRFRLVLKSWRARMGFWVRYYTWKRKLRTGGMNF